MARLLADEGAVPAARQQADSADVSRDLSGRRIRGRRWSSGGSPCPAWSDRRCGKSKAAITGDRHPATQKSGG